MNRISIPGELVQKNHLCFLNTGEAFLLRVQDALGGLEGQEEENDLEGACKLRGKLHLLVSLLYFSIILCTANWPSPREECLCSADSAADAFSSTHADATERRHLGPQRMAHIFHRKSSLFCIMYLLKTHY